MSPLRKPGALISSFLVLWREIMQFHFTVINRRYDSASQLQPRSQSSHFPASQLQIRSQSSQFASFRHSKQGSNNEVVDGNLNK